MKRSSKMTEIHVSATASGKADGTDARPYPTLESARDALRKMKRGGKLTAPVRVLVAAGVYRLAKTLVFTPEDGGTEECPVTWTGVGGRPLLSGARAISGWTEASINGRPCWQAVLPEVVAGKWWFTQLFVNGRRRLSARLPKQGFYRFTGVPDDEAKKDTGVAFHGAMSACFAPGEIRKFRNLQDVEAVLPDHWYVNHLRIALVDEKKNVVNFSTKGYSRFSRDETGRHTRFRLDHVAEACTEPGEWYLDRPTGTLSYIPFPGEQMAAALVEAPVLDLLLLLRGDAMDPAKRVRHLRFEFLDMRHADWELPRDNPGALQSSFNVPAAVRFVGAEDCALHGCRVSQVSGWAVEILRGCHRNRIVACALHDLGGGGIKIGHEGGLPKGWVDGSHGAFRGMDAAALGWGPCREDKAGILPGRDATEASATTVSDCSIHDGGLIFHSAIGVWIGDASRNRVVHNHIWNFNYSGISCGWNWGFMPAAACDNRIDGNHIHGIGHGLLSDMGAIYTLGRQAGSTVSRNYIHDVHSYGYGGWGIYPDEGSSWMRIEDNVVCGTKCGGFHQHYGRDNIVSHNVFADAIENQVQFSRCDMVRPVIFENNLVQGAGNGALLQGDGCVRAKVNSNVYAGDIGRPAKFAGKSWDEWQKCGNDADGSMMDALMLDAVGAATAVANPSALKAAGIDPEDVAKVVADAGPRFRDTLPSSIDDVQPEPETRRAIVETCLWPWPAEWPGEHPWSKLPSCALVAGREPQPLSMTLENRGNATARGSYRLKIVPSNAARINGQTELNVNLKPGARTQLEIAIEATGKASAFRLEAVAEGDNLFDSCLFFSVSKSIVIPRLSPGKEKINPGELLARQPAHKLDGNGCPVVASARFAVSGDRLLVRVDTADAAPFRGQNLWDGSSIELFVAPKPGDPRVQLVAAPLLGKESAVIRMCTTAGIIPVKGAEVIGTATRTGWTIALSIPLSVLGLDPKALSFALDLVVNAAKTKAGGICRTYLAGEFNPYAGSDGYVRVSIKVP